MVADMFYSSTMDAHEEWACMHLSTIGFFDDFGGIQVKRIRRGFTDTIYYLAKNRRGQLVAYKKSLVDGAFYHDGFRLKLDYMQPIK